MNSGDRQPSRCCDFTCCSIVVQTHMRLLHCTLLIPYAPTCPCTRPCTCTRLCTVRMSHCTLLIPPCSSTHSADVTLEFQEAVFGCQKEVDISHLEECTTCNGSGSKPGSTPKTCSQCGGQGQVCVWGGARGCVCRNHACVLCICICSLQPYMHLCVDMFSLCAQCTACT